MLFFLFSIKLFLFVAEINFCSHIYFIHTTEPTMNPQKTLDNLIQIVRSSMDDESKLTSLQAIIFRYDSSYRKNFYQSNGSGRPSDSSRGRGRGRNSSSSCSRDQTVAEKEPHQDENVISMFKDNKVIPGIILCNLYQKMFGKRLQYSGKLKNYLETLGLVVFHPNEGQPNVSYRLSESDDDASSDNESADDVW
jgi:hypothetical protein